MRDYGFTFSGSRKDVRVLKSSRFGFPVSLKPKFTVVLLRKNTITYQDM